MTSIRLVLALFALCSLAGAAHAQEMKSLYERLGGQPAVEAVVKDFAVRCLGDARINQKFAKSDPARLIKNLTDFVCVAAGGPCRYEGRDMKTTHTNMAVTDGEFGALVEDLTATLNQFKVPAKEQGELLGLLGGLKGDVVEAQGDRTGTPLPDAFRPAPGLDVSKPMAEKSLYDRLGGRPAVEAVVKDFAARCLSDARINQKFARSDADRLVENLADFICVAAGGPCDYEGRDMKTAHKNMAVTDGEFGALVEDLVATLDKFNVPATEKGELLGLLGGLKGDIVEAPGDKTATALPKKFKPAPKAKAKAKS